MTVNAPTYDPLGSGIISTLARSLGSLGDPKVCIVSETNVYPCLEIPFSGCCKAGLSDLLFVFPPGRRAKMPRLSGASELPCPGAFHPAGDLIVRLGGGLWGSGRLCAATFLREIRLVRSPPRCGGGGLPLWAKNRHRPAGGGQNLGGCLLPAQSGAVRPGLLKPSRDIFVDGCAEVIKYGVLYDGELFPIWKPRAGF